MWIKKIATSLYMAILVRMIISALLSIGLFFIFITFSNSYVQRQNTSFFEQQQSEINILVEDIKETILEENLTFDETIAKEFVYEDSMYKFYFLGISSNEHNKDFDEIDDNEFYNNPRIYEVSFADQNGFMMVNSNRGFWCK